MLPAWYNKVFSLPELTCALDTSTSKSPGPDRIPFVFLQRIPADRLPELLSFYNYVWRVGFPHQWREAIVVPILKPGKTATDPASYRPIALTNCLCKIMEKMVNWRLQNFMETKALLNPCQSGFRSGHNTLDPLMRLEAAAQVSLTRGHYCVAVFLDIMQAFDKVWHHGLLLKLRSLGLEGRLPRFLQQFLSLRKISVRVDGELSDSKPVFAGVPQGSVISPTLFNIMINDLFDKCPKNVSNSLYADDGALWASGPDLPQLTTTIQEALLALEEWSHSWGLQLSPSKTKAMMFTGKRKVPKTVLLLHQSQIEFVSSYKFLGLTIDRKLSWAPHITRLKETCQADLRLLSIISYRGFGADYTTLRRLYTALLRPKLEYGSFIFSAAAACHLRALDRVQNAALRIILGALRCTRVANLEAEANLPPLTFRRSMLLAKYASRVLTIATHPSAIALRNYCPHGLYEVSPRPLPVTGRAYEEFQTLGIPYRCIPAASVRPKHCFAALPISTSLHVNYKSDHSSSQWRALFQELMEGQYAGWSDIYCDGSLRQGQVACAVWSPTFKLLSRLPSVCSVFTAELCAIYYALRFIVNKPGKYVIFSDSLSSIHSLRSCQTSTNYYVSRIQALLTTFSSGSLSLEWVPSHMGIPGNEAADTLAEEALSLPIPAHFLLPTDDIARKIDHHYANAWQHSWTASANPFARTKPLLGSSVQEELPRRSQIVLTRLRLQTCLLSHGHHFTKTPRAQCTHCSESLTIQHALLDCPQYNTQRQALHNSCAALNLPATLPTLLSTVFPAKCLLTYLTKCDILKLI